MKHTLKRVLVTAMSVGLALTLGAASAQTASSRTLRIAVSTAADHPLTVGAQKFGDLVGDKSAGRIKARVYPGATLGNDVQVIGSLQGGTIDATIVTGGLLTSLAKEYNLYVLPGLLQDSREADAMLDGPFGRKVREGLEAHKLVALAHMEHGFKHIANNKRVVSKWEDVDGIKIRVTQTPTLIDTFSRMGANPVPMPFNEVYTGLEQGAIDGMETTLATFESGKFNEVQKNLTLSGHIYDPLVLLVSKPTWDKLTPDERKVLADSAVEATAYQRWFNREKEARLIGELKQRGIVVTEMSAAEKGRMRERLKSVVEKYGQSVGEPAVREFNAELEKVRAKRM